MESSILSTLERAELAARERSLAAAAEAEAMLTAARADARAVAARVDTRVAQAIAARRERLLATARDEAATVEAELATLDGSAPNGGRSTVAEDLADRIVRAVLGEPAGEDG